MKRLLSLLFLALPLLASDLMLKSGFVTVHTETVFDRSIDPISTQLHANFSIDDDLTTLKGKAYMLLRTLSSDNRDRDEEMYKVLETGQFPIVTFILEDVSRESDTSYTLTGKIDLHGVQKSAVFKGDIEENTEAISINAQSTILMSDFNIEPPCKFFLCVRDRLDLSIKVRFIK